THTKATLIVRSEGDRIRTYCHIGTGNYNPKTARLYTDLGLLTCRPELGRDLVNLFHFLTGYAPGQRYEQVLVAPDYMRSRFEELIEREMANQQETGNGRIIAKMNGLDDRRMVRKLYEASPAGVAIDLIIRGHCTLRPGLPGFSENIRVLSILGRFLEHDRIFYFHNNGQPITIIGSADWRTRNLTRRVELATPVTEPALQQQLIDILHDALADNRYGWELDGDGYYRLRLPAEDEPVRSFQDEMMERAVERSG
ncbi:MAG: polyphosphate kinase 1, partial [Caldilineaceae bacterium]|nr:polyphosphate kinase 1 [Caldilineaceae bacterium]